MAQIAHLGHSDPPNMRSMFDVWVASAATASVLVEERLREREGFGD